MECVLPEDFPVVRHQGRELEICNEGRLEIERKNGEDMLVQYHAIMETFEPRVKPPQHVFPRGSVANMFRSFMGGRKREMVSQLRSNYEQPPELRDQSGNRGFSEGRKSLEKAFLNACTLPSLAARSGKKTVVLYNPSMSSVMRLLSQNFSTFDVYFENDVDDPDDDPTVFDEYRSSTILRLRDTSWRGKVLDHVPHTAFVYCGFSGTAYARFEHSVTLELIPQAYVASGKKFVELSEDEDGVRYRVALFTTKHPRVRRGYFSHNTGYYRYTPDALRRVFQSRCDVTNWGMYGVLSSLILPMFEPASEKAIPVVSSANMMGALCVTEDTLESALTLVMRCSGRTVRDCEMLYRTGTVPLADHPERYHRQRYYVFRHIGIVLDTGRKVMFGLSPYGVLEFMGRRYHPMSMRVPDLILARDGRGMIECKGKRYRVVWHESLEYPGRARSALIPQARISRYIPEPALFQPVLLVDAYEDDGSIELEFAQ